ncbi:MULTISPECIES: signal recognition particle-docking protein FtsY [unclassified Sinorhizobium]|uniref:signal recognition particle-docking protein FtsY n=1 Tax=unclassified Sinorhizobium TaxID=2613772 RepID=UPI0024C243B9|nr:MULTISPECIES: signal recognition particle-docking protein FtsY [unclassified Sinorhizobium]MDK1375892.1 signal recognition particle-docking protein FtsY [Sinorhizobium sp. 6-70]MDK1477637.1 signal recognition particle-docking protein FtsY [Sinorhizobium sp. 6-117]
MAIGFIKKIFSFGKGAVEEKSAPPQEAPEAETITPSVPSEDIHDKEREPAPEATAEDRAAIEEAKAGTEDLGVSPETAAPESEAAGEGVSESTGPAADENVAVEDEGAPRPISPLAGEMLGGAEGGEHPSENVELRDEGVTPPSVPSGHVPHKGGDQRETEVTTEDDRTASREEPAGGDDLPASTETETETEDSKHQEPEANAELAADEAVAMDDESVPPPISPPVGEMPGRAEGGEASSDHAALRDDAATSDSVPSGQLSPKDETGAPSLPKGFATADQRPKEAAPAPQQKLSWYQRLRRGLARTSSQLTGQIASLFTKRKLDEATLQDLEDLLIQADLGVETAMRITDTLASERYGKDVSGEDVSRIMAGEITKVLAPVAKPLELDLSHKPHVILVVGVNGTGKTTTIGKLAAKLSGAGLKVMLAAGDTFRAAAIEQLKIWAERTKSDIVSSKLGADAAGLAYEAFQLAREKKSDVLIIDTAGRLQNKAELMAELEKIVRVLGKLDPDAPHTVLQTLDATTGQNALQQVEIFRNVAGVSGLIMTKLDGTARGGILVAISAKHKLPVYFIGVGEGVDDLEPFEAKDFADAIAGVAA